MKKGGGGGGTNYVKFYDNKHIEYILVDYFSSVLSVELIELQYLNNFLCVVKIALINLDPTFSGYLSVVSFYFTDYLPITPLLCKVPNRLLSVSNKCGSWVDESFKTFGLTSSIFLN